MNSDCIFCRIVAGSEEFRVLKRTEKATAFLTHRPFFEGHTLVVPNAHEAHVFDLNQEDYQAVMDVTKYMAKLLQKVYGGERMGVLVSGFEIDHAHVHVYPQPKRMGAELLTHLGGLVKTDELARVAEKIRSHIKGQEGV
jgi:histidine triad (HIT) family protein